MAFNYYSITASTYIVHKTSNIVTHILHRLRDLTCLTNISLAIGLVSGLVTILFVEMCFRTTSFFRNCISNIVISFLDVFGLSMVFGILGHNQCNSVMKENCHRF